VKVPPGYLLACLNVLLPSPGQFTLHPLLFAAFFLFMEDKEWNWHLYGSHNILEFSFYGRACPKSDTFSPILIPKGEDPQPPYFLFAKTKTPCPLRMAGPFLTLPLSRGPVLHGIHLHNTSEHKNDADLLPTTPPRRRGIFLPLVSNRFDHSLLLW